MKWICKVCGYIYEGTEPPAICPVCKAPKDKFEKLEDSPDWADVHRIAEELSAKHTESGGHRFADILHVATAIHLGCGRFLTFDENQKKIAEAEGMTVPV